MGIKRPYSSELGYTRRVGKRREKVASGKFKFL
jgi:hypothetical protein